MDGQEWYSLGAKRREKGLIGLTESISRCLRGEGTVALKRVLRGKLLPEILSSQS
jgi:hypothetical protein